MSTIREQIMAKIVTTLAGTTGVGTHIYRSRVIPLTRDIAPALVARPSPDMESVTTLGGAIGGAIADRSLSVDIEVYVRGDAPDTLADPIIDSAHRKLMADKTLGGLCENITETGSQWQAKEADLTAGMLSVSYRIKYLTKSGDLSLAP